MNDDLREKIKSDIKKSGFGSEMAALQTIRKLGWRATGSVHYLDMDTGVMRESDIEAHHCCVDASEDERDIRHQSFVSLSIEVKKTERPWIVFKETPTYEFELAEGGSALVFVDGLPKRSNGLRHAISSTSTPKRLGWFGNGMHEAFKNPDQPSRWYAAFVSVCKAAEHTLQANSWPIDPSKPIDHYPYLWLSKPVIVLDGQLVSADLDANAELLIADERWCTVRFVYSSEKYRRRMYFVDVVTLNALGDYLVHEAQRNVRHAETLMRLVGLEQQGGLY